MAIATDLKDGGIKNRKPKFEEEYLFRRSIVVLVIVIKKQKQRWESDSHETVSYASHRNQN